MNKYLIFIIIGILLFLILNNTEKLNIGGPNINDICTIGYNCNIPVGGTCVGQCICIDDGTEQLVNRCMPVRNNITGKDVHTGGGGAAGGGGGVCAVETSSKCPADTKPDEIFRRVLWKVSHLKKTWEERCFILFNNRIEYYKNNTIKGTIMYENIVSSDITTEGTYNILNIVVEDSGRTHKLWTGDYRYMRSVPREEELIEFQQNLISIFRSNYDKCPEKIDGEIYRTILYNVDGEDWIKTCVILFRDRIEYYTGDTGYTLTTITYDSITDIVINIENEYNILSITTDASTYKLWGGHYMWKTQVDVGSNELLQKFKNKIEEIIKIEILFTPAVLNDDKIIEYYNIFKICTSSIIQNEYDPIQVTADITTKFNSHDNYSYISSEFILIDDSKDALLLNISINSENVYLLNLMPGSSQNTSVFYRYAIKIVRRLKQLRNVNKLVIIGHSMGAGTLLLLIICIMENIETSGVRDIISSITCITTGLGLCDSFIIDKFKEYVEGSGGYIEYYDIMNMRGLPNYHSCWINYFVDEFFLKIIIKSNYANDHNDRVDPVMYELIKPYLPIDNGGINLDLISSFDDISRNIELFKQNMIDYLSRHSSIDWLPKNYYEYSEIINTNLRQYYDTCTTEPRGLYNCKELRSLFHKHMSFNTFAILPEPYNGFFSYNKNELLYLILGENEYIETDVISIQDILYNSIKNTDTTLCFSNINEPIEPRNYNPAENIPPRSTWKPDWGAHTLKSYHNRIMELKL